jgi:hypothetical protein
MSRSAHRCRTFANRCDICFAVQTRFETIVGGAFHIQKDFSVVFTKQMFQPGVDKKRTQEFQEAVMMLLHSQKCEIQSLTRQVAGFENNFRYMQQKITECITYVKRIQPYVDKAMKALHKSFTMLCTGILNLREETSEFAGTILHDV